MRRRSRCERGPAKPPTVKFLVLIVQCNKTTYMVPNPQSSCQINHVSYRRSLAVSLAAPFCHRHTTGGSITLTAFTVQRRPSIAVVRANLFSIRSRHSRGFDILYIRELRFNCPHSIRFCVGVGAEI